MKKTSLISSLLLAGLTLASCGAGKTGEAYGLSHGGSYVTKATVTLKGDKIEDATLIEVCFPSQVKAGAEVPAADKVSIPGKHGSTDGYKTFKFAGHTFVYDEVAGDWKEGELAFKTFLADEAGCKAYYDAVMNSQISVVVNGQEDATILTKASLCKEDNGYWTVEGASKWISNRDASIEFLKANGIEAVKGATKNTETRFWEYNGVASGATWSDFNSDTTGKGYFSYAQLLSNAYDNAK